MSPDDFGGRSAEERERARLEREARRAAQRGEAPPVNPPTPTAEQPTTAGNEGTPEPRRSPRDRAADRAAAARVALRNRRKRAEKSAPPPRDSPSPPYARKRWNSWKSGFAAAAVLIALFVVWFLFSLFQPFKGEGEGSVRVSIPTGAGVSDIADILDENGVIDGKFFFRTRVTVSGSRGDLKPGSYEMKKEMSYGDAIDILSAGPPRDIVTVTIPEGRSRSEIEPIVDQAGLSGDYKTASVRSSAINLSRYNAGRAESLEGFLFPATYELKRGASAKGLVEKQLEAFEREFEGIDMRYARKKNLNRYDVLIIASMVEREAGVAKDRPLIASVIYNRLKNGIPLGIDATIRFATGNWEKPLTESELASEGPYNTRKVAGLPPGPIGNPGTASIEAAANPANTDFLFFVVKPCGEGEHVFSETNEQFLRDVERYNAERDAQGGQSPTDC